MDIHQLTVYQLLILFGFPTVFLAFCGYLVKKLKELAALKKGLQALLRNSLIDKIHEGLEKEYAPMYMRDNVANMYEQYHNLGKNGVMNDLYKDFMNLPTTKPKKG